MSVCMVDGLLEAKPSRGQVGVQNGSNEAGGGAKEWS